MKGIETFHQNFEHEVIYISIVEVKNKNIWIDGSPKMLIGGEFHYFRAKKHEWEDRIKKIKMAGFNMVSTYIPWIVHERNEGVFDFRNGEKDLYYFMELVKAYGLFCLVRPGPYVMSELKNEGLPHWIYEKYTHILADTRGGEKHPCRVVSLMHPDFKKLVEKWYFEVCGILKQYLIDNGGPIIMFQLDNEVGMLNWISNSPDMSGTAIDMFLSDIKNSDAGISYESRTLKELLLSQDCPLYLQNMYMDFMRRYYKEYFLFLKNTALKNGITVPFVINVHGFTSHDYAKRGKEYPIGLSQLKAALGIDGVVTAGDYYVGNIIPENYTDITIVNGFTQALQNREQPLFSAEFQSGSIFGYPKLQPTTYDLNTRLCVAQGMNSFNYYMFVGGEHFEDDIWLFNRKHDWQAPIGPDGKERIAYSYIKRTVESLRGAEKLIIRTQNIYDTVFGFYPDYFRTEYRTALTQEFYEKLKSTRETALFYGLLRGLILNNYQIESQNIQDGDISGKTAVIFSALYMDRKTQEKIAEYISCGGTAIIYPTLPLYDMNGEKCEVLKELVEVKIKRNQDGGFAKIFDIDCIACSSSQIYEPSKDSIILGSLESTSETVAFEKKVGKGRAIVLGVNVSMNFIHHISFTDKLALYAGIEKIVQAQELSVAVKKSSEGYIIFVNNFDEYPKPLDMSLNGKSVFEGEDVVIPARSGLILPYRLRINEKNEVIFSSCEIMQLDEDRIKFRCVNTYEVIKLLRKAERVECKEYDIVELKDGVVYRFKNCQGSSIGLNI